MAAGSAFSTWSRPSASGLCDGTTTPSSATARPASVTRADRWLHVRIAHEDYDIARGDYDRDLESIRFRDATSRIPAIGLIVGG